MTNKGINLVAILSSLIIACSSSKTATTITEPKLNLFTAIPDSEEKKTLYGIIDKELITKDTAFSWYASNLTYYKVDSTTVQRIRSKKEKIHLVLFCGTWCHDSQQLVPKYFSTLQAAGFPDDQLTIIGVDRDKQTIGQLSQTFNIINIPTLIVMKDGIEKGRIVEYGKTALVDKELGELISTIM